MAGVGRMVRFHGSFATKGAAVRKERETPGSYILPTRIRRGPQKGAKRFLVLTERGRDRPERNRAERDVVSVELTATELQLLVDALGYVQRQLKLSRQAGLRKWAGELRDRLASYIVGARPNPTVLVVGPNPPRGQELGEVLYLEYLRKSDGREYFHDFTPGNRLLAMPDGSIRIYHPRRPLWVAER